MKKFIITIDTEGDDLWSWKEGYPLYTENVNYLPRFQDLCDQFGFIPTWLCNWEMANDERFCTFAKNNLVKGTCEIGMHLHAWNTPPEYSCLPRCEKSGLPYLVEYPVDVMEKKIVTMTEVIKEKLGVTPIVHRAGRWAMDERYFALLAKHGYIADCSVTPYVNWEKSYGQTPGFMGPNYFEENVRISKRCGILELPVTTLWNEEDNKAFWLRPNRKNLDEMRTLIRYYANSEFDYVMFMLHSSELMPGGSPTFQTEGGIEILYEHLKIIFSEISQYYEGIGLESYAKSLM